MKGLKIRSLNEQDVEAAVHVQDQAFDGEFTEFARKEFCKSVQEPEDYLYTLVGELDGQIVATAALATHVIAVNAFALTWVAVLPEYQGQGIGSELIRKLCTDGVRHLSQEKPACILLSADGEHIAYYEKFGFGQRDLIHDGLTLMVKVID